MISIIQYKRAISHKTIGITKKAWLSKCTVVIFPSNFCSLDTLTWNGWWRIFVVTCNILLERTVVTSIFTGKWPTFKTLCLLLWNSIEVELQKSDGFFIFAKFYRRCSSAGLNIIFFKARAGCPVETVLRRARWIPDWTSGKTFFWKKSGHQGFMWLLN